MEILNGQIPLVVYLRGIGGTVSMFAPTGLRLRVVWKFTIYAQE